MGDQVGPNLTVVNPDVLSMFSRHMDWENALKQSTIASFDPMRIKKLLSHPAFPQETLWKSLLTVMSVESLNITLFDLHFEALSNELRSTNRNELLEKAAAAGSIHAWEHVNKIAPAVGKPTYSLAHLERAIMGGNVAIFHQVLSHPDIQRKVLDNTHWEGFYESAEIHHPTGQIRIDILKASPADLFEKEKQFLTAATGWQPEAPPQKTGTA